MGLRDHTDIGGAQEAFLTTHWSLVESVEADSSDDKNCALIGLLLERYWKPVYCYLRCKGYANEPAKDLTQGFFYEVVLGRNLIQRADRSKGRFRTYILKALHNYVATVHATQTAQKRAPAGKLIPLDMVDPPGFSRITQEFTPEESFDYAWVSALMERVLEAVETKCYEDGKSVHWHVFHEKVLAPILDGADSVSLAELCHKYGIESPAVASNMIVTVKRCFRSILREHLRSTVLSDGEMAEESEQISRFLPRIAQARR